MPKDRMPARAAIRQFIEFLLANMVPILLRATEQR